ncbi:MAG: O-antigen ligase family protein [Nitriliruptorales bacterium]|nr:O-antigen ligase family protein [Nitriliruptorales bacterium]
MNAVASGAPSAGASSPRTSGRSLRRRIHLLWLVLGLTVLVQLVTGRTGSILDVVPIGLGWAAWLFVPRLPSRLVLRIHVVVMLFASAVAIGSLVVGLPGALGEGSGFYALKGTITTPIGDHNELAGWLLVAVAIAAGVRTRRSFALTVLGLGLGATLSRGALVAGFGAVAIGWFLHLDRDLIRRTGSTLVIAALVVLGAVALLDTTAPVDGPSSSAAARVELWGVAVGDVGDHPLLGVGLGSFEETAVDVAGPHHHAHNGPLHAVAELGLIAGLLAAMRLPLATWLLLRRGSTRLAQVAGLAGLVLLLHDQVEALTFRPVYELVVGTLLALAVQQAAKGRQVPS